MPSIYDFPPGSSALISWQGTGALGPDPRYMLPGQVYEGQILDGIPTLFGDSMCLINKALAANRNDKDILWDLPYRIPQGYHVSIVEAYVHFKYRVWMKDNPPKYSQVYLKCPGFTLAAHEPRYSGPPNLHRYPRLGESDGTHLFTATFEANWGEEVNYQYELGVLVIPGQAKRGVITF